MIVEGRLLNVEVVGADDLLTTNEDHASRIGNLQPFFVAWHRQQDLAKPLERSHIAFARRRVDVSALAFRPPERLPSCPRLTPLNLSVSRPQLMLIGASHEAFRIRESEAAICALLNGTHHLTELKTSQDGIMLNDGLDRLLYEARRIGAFAPEASEVRRNVVRQSTQIIPQAHP